MANKDDKLTDRELRKRETAFNRFLHKYRDKIADKVSAYAKMVTPSFKDLKDYLLLNVKVVFNRYGKENGLLDKLKFTPTVRKEWVKQLRERAASVVPAMSSLMRNAIAFDRVQSYYQHSFALERSVKVPVVPPSITADELLKKADKPWLPDGGAFSDRLYRNTTALADTVNAIIKKATDKGWSVEQTAKLISEHADITYRQAVTLARTEFTRAVSQGASEAMLAQADILEGKRWDATLDSKTAPRDAANDGNIYPLDYDTPANPGRVGERIPNHTNCRCLWSAVLRKLGVSKAERIAKDLQGNRVFTAANTYREYAEKYGLPDLDERLRTEDPRRYLRRGEST